MWRTCISCCSSSDSVLVPTLSGGGFFSVTFIQSETKTSEVFAPVDSVPVCGSGGLAAAVSPAESVHLRLFTAG